MLCSPADDQNPARASDAIAVDLDGTHGRLRTVMANDLFERVLARDAFPALAGFTVRTPAPQLRDHRRTDFLLASPDE